MKLNIKLIVRIWISLFLFVNLIQAEIYFPDTAPEQQVKTYTKRNVKGKEVITYNVFPHQVYYVYVSSGEGSIINVSSPIKNIVVGAPELIQIAPQEIEGQTFFMIRPKGKLDKYFSTTMQVICKDYNAIIEVILTPYMSQQNKIVNLQDGTKETNQMIYTQNRFLELKSDFDERVSKREKLMSKMLFNETTHFPIEQIIDIQNSKLELKNLSMIQNTYMFNIEFRGNDKVALNKDKLFLYVTPYKTIVMNESKGSRNLYYPEDIILFENEKGHQCATVLFRIRQANKTPRFYVSLHLTDSIIFETKINLDLIASFDTHLFDVQTR